MLRPYYADDWVKGKQEDSWGHSFFVIKRVAKTVPKQECPHMYIRDRKSCLQARFMSLGVYKIMYANEGNSLPCFAVKSDRGIHIANISKESTILVEFLLIWQEISAFWGIS
jgi:hypothetical protein